MMTYDVLVTKEKSQRYTARVLLLPDIVVSGDTEEEVLEQVKTAITDLRSHSRIVQLDVPSLNDDESNPWLRYAGLWANDPDWEIFRAEVEAFRKAIDARGGYEVPVQK